MDSGIYLITCVPTKQSYVGTAIHWGKRINQHVNALKAGRHKNKKMQEAWDKHHAADFTFKLLEECPVDVLLEREKYWVAELDTDHKGFNSSSLGSNGNLGHGQTYNRTYKSWDSMKQRCTNTNSPDYPRYGGAGVLVCQQWLDSFESFHADMGDRPLGTSLDRYPDKHGNYEPTNCRWATAGQQQRNVRNNQYLTMQGETKLLIDWAVEYNIPVDLLRKRQAQGATDLEFLAASYSRFVGVKDADGRTVITRRQLPPAKTYTAHGKTLSIAQWAKVLDISESALKQRLFKYKMPLEEALQPGYRKKGKAGPRQGHHMIEAFGKTQSLTSWARETGIPVTTLKNRLYRANMQPEEALKASLWAKQRGNA